MLLRISEVSMLDVKVKLVGLTVFLVALAAVLGGAGGQFLKCI